MNRFYISFLFFSILFSCEEEKQIENLILTKKNIEEQTFYINQTRDTFIKGKGGTIIRIFKNSFASKNIKDSIQEVKIVLKEILTLKDILLGGIETISNNKILESDGMIYIQAESKGNILELDSNKFLGVVMPCIKTNNKMAVYEGEEFENGLNWVNPSPTLNQDLQNEFDHEYMDEHDYAISTTAIIEEDSLIEVTREELNSGHLNEDKEINKELNIGGRFEIEILQSIGTNTGQIDINTTYIFKLKKLGWANIDVLYTDKRNKEVSLLTLIKNEEQFKSISISMLIEGKKIFIPGYKRKDIGYGFTHNDEEKPILPIGANATIITTAMKGRTPYYSAKRFTIQASQEITLEMKESSEEKIKEDIFDEVQI